MEKMDLIIFAGKSESIDPICEQENVSRKAFVKLGDKTFIEHQIEEVLKCDFIGTIYITGMSEKDWETEFPVVFVDAHGTTYEKAEYVYYNYLLKKENPPDNIILLSSDIPLVKSEMIHRFVKKCQEVSGGKIDGIFYYPLASKKDMESKFPKSNRTYINFKEVQACAADIQIINPSKLVGHKELFLRLTAKGKSIIGQLIIVNPIFLFRYITRRLTIQKLIEFLNKNLFKVDRGIYTFVLDDAELAMDVDKKHQLAEVRRYYKETFGE